MDAQHEIEAQQLFLLKYLFWRELLRWWSSLCHAPHTDLPPSPWEHAKQGLSFVVRWMPRPLFVQCTDGSSERQQLSGFYSPSCKGSVNLSLLSANRKVWDDRKPLKNALTRLCSPCGAAFFRREGKPSSRVSGLEADLQSRGRWKESVGTPQTAAARGELTGWSW